MLRDLRQILVDGHQVIGLPARFRESLLKELIKRFQVLQPPVLSCPNLAQILPELDEPHVPLLVLRLLPGENLIDLVKDKQGPPAIEFRATIGSLLVHKLVKPIKVARSRSANQVNVDQLLVVSRQSPRCGQLTQPF